MAQPMDGVTYGRHNNPQMAYSMDGATYGTTHGATHGWRSLWGKPLLAQPTAHPTSRAPPGSSYPAEPAVCSPLRLAVRPKR
eukprot:3649297-Pyramimonas_sp.AAC.1